MTVDPVLIDVLTKLGFAGLCVWLVLDTRHEARLREERMAKALNDTQAETSRIATQSAAALEAVAAAVHRLADALGARPCLVRSARPELKAVVEELNKATERRDPEESR